MRRRVAGARRAAQSSDTRLNRRHDRRGFRAGATLSGAISVTAGLTKTGDRLLILTGTSTYAGVTTIAAGTLQIGDGGTTGSIAGDVVNNANLVFKRSDTYAFTGAITGGGTVPYTGQRWDSNTYAEEICWLWAAPQAMSAFGKSQVSGERPRWRRKSGPL